MILLHNYKIVWKYFERTFFLYVLYEWSLDSLYFFNSFDILYNIHISNSLARKSNPKETNNIIKTVRECTVHCAQFYTSFSSTFRSWSCSSFVMEIYWFQWLCVRYLDNTISTWIILYWKSQWIFP